MRGGLASSAAHLARSASRVESSAATGICVAAVGVPRSDGTAAVVVAGAHWLGS